jgi:3-hydroxyacyl-[acyl-carrier-protein] dehydratase
MNDLLLNNFFTITEITYDEENPEKLHAQLQLDITHAIYQGHFPGNPVVPGVCIIQMIKETLSQHFSKELILVKAEEVKFLSIINPLENPSITLEYKIKHPGDELVHVTVVISNNDDHTFMKFRGSFR